MIEITQKYDENISISSMLAGSKMSATENSMTRWTVSGGAALWRAFLVGLTVQRRGLVSYFGGGRVSLWGAEDNERSRRATPGNPHHRSILNVTGTALEQTLGTSGAVERFERCSLNESRSCFGEEGSRPQRQMSHVARIFDFLKNDLNTGCNLFETRSACVREKRRGCPTDGKNNFFKKLWAKVEESVDYVCKDKRQEFTEKRECLSKQELSSTAQGCEKGGRRHTCSDYHKTVKCVNEAIFNACGSESQNLMDRLVRNAVGLNDADEDCEQSSSSRRREDSKVLSFIMCTASLMLALLVN